VRTDWHWDETLYRGSAPYYARGRLPYPGALVDALREELSLDGSGRLLDVGCGPGSLTALLAPLFAEAVGIDADEAMVREAQRAVPGARFLRLRAEQLPAGLGTFRVVTAAQSFHWLEPSVARTLREVLDPTGSFVHVGATTHEGDGNVPRDEIAALVRSYLGPRRRAGAGALPGGTRNDERELLESYGFSNRRELEIARTEVFERSEDDVVASVFSLSSAAPHLFGGRLADFERDLRALLCGRGPFYERARDITATIWDR
jgi:SAM-dependent methyltransferase